MLRLLFVYLFIYLFLHYGYTQKYDYQWAFGYGSNLSNGFGISLLNFNENLVIIEAYAEPEMFELDSGASFICNREGELILMTNNCEVINKDFNIIEGGEDLTPGTIHNEYCQNGDYPAAQSTLFIPEMSKDSIYYLLHKDTEIWDEQQDLVSRHFYLSTIIERIDGSFYLKEKVLLSDNNMIVNRLTAGINHSQDKWWTYAIDYASNRFHFFLIGGDAGYEALEVQEIGIDIHNFDLDIGQTMFSPDGQLLALNSEVDGVLLYDFDNETGQLSNFRSISYPNMDTARGLVFSPNSRFIYLSTAEHMYQLDLEETDTSMTIVHLGYVRSFDDDGWPVGLGYMYLGPDCRIYISPGTTSHYMHTIHQPNLKGMDCELEERSMRVPTNVKFHLPNLPMYRFNGNCDSTIAWGIPTDISAPVVVEEFKVYPNPATDRVTVVVPESWGRETLMLTDISGKVIKIIPVHQRVTIELPSQDLGNGIYFLSPSTHKEYSLKLVIGQ